MVLDFDVILEDVGDFGLYQKFVVYLLCVPGCFMNAFGVAFVFLCYTPDFLCVSGDSGQRNESYRNWSDSSLVRACSYGLDDHEDRGLFGNDSSHHCSNFAYDQGYFKETVVTQWNLVCDRAIYLKTMMSLHSVTTLFGCLINSYFQDLWGRKRAFFIAVTANLIGGLSSVLAPSFLVYAILRSFIAFSTWHVSYTWALEYVGPSKRSVVTMIMCVLYGVAATVVGGLAWLCDTWIKLTLATTVPFLLLYSYAFLIDESPRWLISRGRNTEALKTVRKMARWERKNLEAETVQKLLADNEQEAVLMTNRERRAGERVKDENGRTLTKEEMLFQLDGSKVEVPVGTTKQNPRVQDLFLTRNLRWKTCLITYCWAANLLTYSAIAYNMENLKGNLFVTYTLQAAVEIPSSVLVVFLLDRYGRIPPLSIFMVACGLLLFCTVPIDFFGLNPWIIITLTLAAKFGISLSFAVLVQLAGESYPTQLRGLGTGFSSFVGSLGSAIMPYVVHSAKVYKTLPMILMGATVVTSGLSVLMLPDTIGRYMPEIIAEAERGESVGYAALKENWRAMRCSGRKAYKAVKKSEISDNSRNGRTKKNDEF